MINNSTNSN